VTSEKEKKREMADNIYFNCNLFMELLDRHTLLQQKFSKVNEELFNDMGGSFALATHQLAASPVTAESAQALMMCWSAIRTLKQEQTLLAESADRIISYLVQMKPAASASFEFVQPAQPVQPPAIPEKPKRAKRTYAPRKPAASAAKKQKMMQDQQQQQQAEEFLKERDARARDDLKQILEHLEIVKADSDEKKEEEERGEEAVAPKTNFYFDPDQDGSQVPDW
jgi:hypothetical protein